MENQLLINYMNQLLSNQFVMYVKLHRYHWYIQGEQFFSLHGKFEEMYEGFAKDLDEVAERILIIKGKPLATMAKYLQESTLVEASADNLEVEIVEQLVHDYNKICTEIKEIGIPLAETLNDGPTADLLTGYQGKLEKYLWMLRAYQIEE